MSDQQRIDAAAREIERDLAEAGFMDLLEDRSLWDRVVGAALARFAEQTLHEQYGKDGLCQLEEYRAARDESAYLYVRLEAAERANESLRKRDRAFREEIGGLRHHVALIEADTLAWQTDASTPAFQRVRNMVADVERLTRERDEWKRGCRSERQRAVTSEAAAARAQRVVEVVARRGTQPPGIMDWQMLYEMAQAEIRNRTPAARETGTCVCGPGVTVHKPWCDEGKPADPGTGKETP